MSSSSLTAPHARPRSPLDSSADALAAAGAALKGEDLLQESTQTVDEGAVGRLDEAYYEKLLPRWRFRLRKKLMQSLEGEMVALVRIQKRWRTPWRDEYFVKTSLLGTHTWFMLFLPLWYWFGLPEVGRGLLYVLAVGAYVTGLLKDAFSVPRPFSPPVVRLSVGSHALEYGFPSTHSSNACSMSLFCADWVLSRDWDWARKTASMAVLVVFCFSIVFGRLYTGMHSRADVLAGSSIGTAIWWLHHRYSADLDKILVFSGWAGTLSTLSTLFLVLSTHPEPAEPCPCFEDTVAFLSVVQGAMIGIAWSGLPALAVGRRTVSWEWSTAEEKALWAAAAGVKVVGGISTILVWRIIAKQACHALLPPIFRFFAPVIQLPRRGYLQSTECAFQSRFSSRGAQSVALLTILRTDDTYPPEDHLDPVPSLLDLPSLVDDSAVSPAASSSSPNLAPPSALRHRLPRPPSTASSASTKQSQTRPLSDPPEHIDADVLTKVVVYSGIGWLATIGLPRVFEVTGLSV
ncbi:hypothetical protein JCM11641_003847 [Rhodosporidiobolus odoratus]